VGDILDIAVEMGVVEKRGSFYSHGETRLGQGRENAKSFLRENPEMTLMIENRIREAKGLPIWEVASRNEQAAQEIDR
jgi:recombination protein RecA